jgi:hypothetical protein
MFVTFVRVCRSKRVVEFVKELIIEHLSFFKYINMIAKALNSNYRRTPVSAQQCLFCVFTFEIKMRCSWQGIGCGCQRKNSSTAHLSKGKTSRSFEFQKWRDSWHLCGPSQSRVAENKTCFVFCMFCVGATCDASFVFCHAGLILIAGMPTIRPFLKFERFTSFAFTSRNVTIGGCIVANGCQQLTLNASHACCAHVLALCARVDWPATPRR